MVFSSRFYGEKNARGKKETPENPEKPRKKKRAVDDEMAANFWENI